MIEVIKKVDKYRILCECCHSLLSYDDEYDELGFHEYEEMVRKSEENRRLNGHILATPVHSELYIWCPICKNKVITAKINSITHSKYHLGQRI